ncbi:hypothetical protein DFH27DRAFT_637438 [Peziza echinospora]|nr:hypothetical protein DFH27DRAFT_637438 [Peziza echinospora]
MGHIATHSEAVCVIGDLNAAMAFADIFSGEVWDKDACRRVLQHVVRNNDLMVMNFTTMGNARPTFRRNDSSSSVLDYAIAPRLLCLEHRIAFHVHPILGAEHAKVAVIARFEGYGDPDEPSSPGEEWIPELDEDPELEPGFDLPQGPPAHLLQLYGEGKKRLSSMRKTVRKAREADLHERISQSRGSKQYWNAIKKALGKGTTQSKLPPKRIARKIREVFAPPDPADFDNASLAEAMEQELGKEGPPYHPLLDDVFSIEEIDLAVKLQRHSSDGEGAVSVHILRRMDLGELKTLLDMVVDTLTTPMSWSRAEIVSIPKPGGEDFRPISVLPRLRRLYTSLVLIQKAAQRGSSLYLVLADLTKAFDLVDRDLDIRDPDDPVLYSWSKIDSLLLADDLLYASTTVVGAQRKTNAMMKQMDRLRGKVSLVKTVTIAFGVPRAPVYDYSMMMGEIEMKRVYEVSHNGFLLVAGNGWNSGRHLRSKLSKAMQTLSSLMVLRRHIGVTSSAEFYALYRAVSEPVLHYGIELCVDFPNGMWKKLNDLQVRAARFGMGIPSSTNLLLTTTDMGELPLSEVMMNQVLRFVVYVLALPPQRPVRMALQAILDVSRWGGPESRNGWMGHLGRRHGSDEGVILGRLVDGMPSLMDPDEWQQMPERHLSTVISRVSAALTSQILGSTRYIFMHPCPPVVRRRGCRLKP